MLKQVSRAVVSFTLTGQLGISPPDMESEGGSVEKTSMTPLRTWPSRKRRGIETLNSIDH